MAKFCFECGAKLEGAKFCPECGKATGAGLHSVPVAPVPPPVPSFNYDNQPSAIATGDVPSAATGEEATAIYKRTLAIVRSVHGSNKAAVSAFKNDCKLYGQGNLPADVFVANLEGYFGSAGMRDQMMPQLVRLIPDEDKRAALIKHKPQKSRMTSVSSSKWSNDSSSATDSPRYNNSSTFQKGSGCDSSRYSQSSIGSGGDSKIGSSLGSSKQGPKRYADHPNCDICNAPFEYSKRRHQCRKCGLYVCRICSPALMLIPPGQQIDNAKGYDPAIPQRVCTVCAPLLQPMQDELSNTYANCHRDNPHEAKTRLHMPYSKNLEKECRNAADIIGNFFRPDFGASSDRGIPVSFLERADGLAFLTIIKAGFLITGKVGTGLVISKIPNPTNTGYTWSAPSAIGTAGIGGGLEMGGEIVEFMIILGSKSACKVFHRTQVNVGGGLDLTVGPYGRAAVAQASAGKGGLGANYSYSHSRGLFAGISLHGAVITTRKEMNSKFYGRQLAAEDILSGKTEQPKAAECLYEAIDKAMNGVQEYHENVATVMENKNYCNQCSCQRFVAKTFSSKCKHCSHTHV